MRPLYHATTDNFAVLGECLLLDVALTARKGDISINVTGVASIVPEAHAVINFRCSLPGSLAKFTNCFHDFLTERIKQLGVNNPWLVKTIML
jgi:hypothetical protein